MDRADALVEGWLRECGWHLNTLRFIRRVRPHEISRVFYLQRVVERLRWVRSRLAQLEAEAKTE